MVPCLFRLKFNNSDANGDIEVLNGWGCVWSDGDINYLHKVPHVRGHPLARALASWVLVLLVSSSAR